jgi:pimeloyl-ACP methyl ester carboxylesterase
MNTPRKYVLLFLLILVVTLSACQKKSGTQLAEGVVHDSVASADGVMIHYSAQGSGSPALVFVHGWGCDRTYWVNQVDHCARNYRVVTIDLAGHGESGLNRQEWSINAYGEDVAAVVNKLGLDEVILVGHSMGGPIAVEAAPKLAANVLGLIGVDCFQSFVWEYSEEQVDGYLASFRDDFSATTENWVREMFPPTADSVLVERIATDMARLSPEVGLGSLQSLFTLDQAELLKASTLPITAINADMWPTDVEANREIYPNFEVILMPGYGHFIHLEDPASFNSYLSSAVREIRAETVEG